MEVSSSKDKAKDNDKKTQAQMLFCSEETVNKSLFGGTFACLDPNGNLSEDTPYRFVPLNESYYLYSAQMGYAEEGSLEELSHHSKYRLSGEKVQKQIIYYQENGFVMTIDDRDYVFAKISDEVIIPEGI